MPVERTTPITIAIRTATHMAKSGWTATREGISAIFHSMTIRPPSRPPTIPIEIPKFRPMPHWTAGTIASASTPYIPQRRMMSLTICIRSMPNPLAVNSSSRKNPPMMIRGNPTCRTTPLTLSRMRSAPFLLVCTGHRKPVFRIRVIRFEDAGEFAVRDNRDPVADRTQLDQLG